VSILRPRSLTMRNQDLKGALNEILILHSSLAFCL
jgi:hypothetical protein